MYIHARPTFHSKKSPSILGLRERGGGGDTAIGFLADGLRPSIFWKKKVLFFLRTAH